MSPRSTAYPYVKEVAPHAAMLKLAPPIRCRWSDPRLRCFGRPPAGRRRTRSRRWKPRSARRHRRRGQGVLPARRRIVARTGARGPGGRRPDGAPRRTSSPDITPMARPAGPVCGLSAHCELSGAARHRRARGRRYRLLYARRRRAAALDRHAVSMGSSIANAVGMAASGVEKKPIVATIGDSTFLHSGIAPLVDAVYNNANITVILLDNSITAMTGGQDHPGTGRTLRGEADAQGRLRDNAAARSASTGCAASTPTRSATCTRRCREAIGIQGRLGRHFLAALRARPGQDQGHAFAVAAAGCTACQSCMNLGCPAITWDRGNGRGPPQSADRSADSASAARSARRSARRTASSRSRRE